MDTFKQILDPYLFLPMVEAAGTIANDISGNEMDGVYVNAPALQNLTLPNGDKIPLFDGTEEVTFWSTAFRDAFNGNQGSLIALCKVADVEWEDGVGRTLVSIRGNNDLLTIAKSLNSYCMTANRQIGASPQQGYFYPSGKNDVMVLVVTWDHAANQFYIYADGLLSFILVAPEWTETITTGTYTRIGRSSAAGSDYWIGNGGYVGITDKVLSAAEVKSLFQELYPTTQDLFIIGDSKSTGAVGGWRAMLLQSLETAEGARHILNPTRFNIGGYDVGEMADWLEAELTSSTATPANILINLGANDVPEPTPEAQFKAEYKRIIDRCKSIFPGVPIYLAGPLLRNDGLVTSEKLALINAYIADLVTSESVNAGISEVGLTLGDGVHYSAADLPIVATRWLTVLGY